MSSYSANYHLLTSKHVVDERVSNYKKRELEHPYTKHQVYEYLDLIEKIKDNRSVVEDKFGPGSKEEYQMFTELSLQMHNLEFKHIGELPSFEELKIKIKKETSIIQKQKEKEKTKQKQKLIQIEKKKEKEKKKQKRMEELVRDIIKQCNVSLTDVTKLKNEELLQICPSLNLNLLIK